MHMHTMSLADLLLSLLRADVLRVCTSLTASASAGAISSLESASCTSTLQTARCCCQHVHKSHCYLTPSALARHVAKCRQYLCVYIFMPISLSRPGMQRARERASSRCAATFGRHVCIVPASCLLQSETSFAPVSLLRYALPRVIEWQSFCATCVATFFTACRLACTRFAPARTEPCHVGNLAKLRRARRLDAASMAYCAARRPHVPELRDACQLLRTYKPRRHAARSWKIRTITTSSR